MEKVPEFPYKQFLQKSENVGYLRLVTSVKSSELL